MNGELRDITSRLEATSNRPRKVELDRELGAADDRALPGVDIDLQQIRVQRLSGFYAQGSRRVTGPLKSDQMVAQAARRQPGCVDEQGRAPFEVGQRVGPGLAISRIIVNVDVSRRMADLQPGTSGEALERHYFGSVRPDAASTPSRRRFVASR